MIPIDLMVEKSSISIIWGNPTLGCNVLSVGKLNPIFWIVPFLIWPIFLLSTLNIALEPNVDVIVEIVGNV